MRRGFRKAISFRRVTNGTTEPGEPVAAADAPPPLLGTEPAVASGTVFRATQSALVIPPECACCVASSARTIRETHFTGRTAFIPYCADCHAHVSKEETRHLAMTLSSGIVALTLAAGLPLAWQPRSATLYALCVLAGGLIPLVVGALWPRTRAPGHTAFGRAAELRMGGSLVCANAGWGRAAARGSGADSFPIRYHERRVPRGTMLALVVLCAALPVYYRVHFPTVRVVNLTDGRLEIVVDGAVRASVPPTSAESTGAGVEIRVAAGPRVFTARDERGRTVDTAGISIRTGAQHLYAPASEPYCFWIETTGYGRSKGAGTRVEPLTGPPRLWVLDDAIDLWFSPTPDADFDDRSTGGFLRALRQARCEAAPGFSRRGGENSLAPPFATGVE